MNLSSKIDGTHTFNVTVDETSLTRKIYLVEKQNPEIAYLSQKVTARTLPGAGEVVANLLMNTQVKKLGICANQALVEWNGKQCFIPETAITEELITPEMEYVNALLANKRKELNIWLNNTEENFQSSYNGYLLLEQTLDAQWLDPKHYNFTANAYDGAMSSLKAIGKWIVGDYVGSAAGAAGDSVNWLLSLTATDIERLLADSYASYLSSVLSKDSGAAAAFTAEMELREAMYKVVTENPDIIKEHKDFNKIASWVYKYLSSDVGQDALDECAAIITEVYPKNTDFAEKYFSWTLVRKNAFTKTGIGLKTGVLVTDCITYAKEQKVSNQYWTNMYYYMAAVNDGYLDMLDSYIETFKNWKNLQTDTELINVKTGGSTKYVNQRDKQFLEAYLQEFNYRKEFTDAVDLYIDAGSFKYGVFTNKVYKSIFCEKADEYREVLQLKTLSILPSSRISYEPPPL